MERIWLKSYPPGVPADINPDEYKSLVELFETSVGKFGVLRAGDTVVNVNPLYTARELEYQLRDSGAEAIVILENFAHVLQEVLARTPIRHIVVTSLGELLGLKGLIVNLVVRKLKKMVPAYELPGAVSFRRSLAEGARGRLDTPALGHDDIAFLQ